MTPRMLHQAQAQETAYQYGLEENKTKIDYCGSFLPAGLLSQFATGAESPILDRLSTGLSARPWHICHRSDSLCHFALSAVNKPLHSIANKAVRGGVA